MIVRGSSVYEWVSHNIFVAVLALGAVAAMGYFLYASQKKGRYRQ